MAVTDAATDSTATTPALLRADSRYATLPRPVDGTPVGPRPGTPPSLATAGGLLLAIGTTGAWQRVTQIAEEGADPAVIAETTGLELTGGIVLLVLGALLAVSGPIWARAGKRVRRAGAAFAAITAAVGVGVMTDLQRVIDRGTADAIAAAQFTEMHIGAGWGVWAAGIGVAFAALAALVELLVRLDRPIPTTSVDPSDDGTTSGSESA